MEYTNEVFIGEYSFLDIIWENGTYIIADRLVDKHD